MSELDAPLLIMNLLTKSKKDLRYIWRKWLREESTISASSLEQIQNLIPELKGLNWESILNKVSEFDMDTLNRTDSNGFNILDYAFVAGKNKLCEVLSKKGVKWKNTYLMQLKMQGSECMQVNRREAFEKSILPESIVSIRLLASNVIKSLREATPKDELSLLYDEENFKIFQDEIFLKMQQLLISGHNAVIESLSQIQDLELAKFIDLRDEDGNSLLDYAYIAGFSDIAKDLVSLGADVSNIHVIHANILQSGHNKKLHDDTYQQILGALQEYRARDKDSTLLHENITTKAINFISENKLSIALLVLGVICIAAAPFTGGMSLMIFAGGAYLICSSIGFYQVSRYFTKSSNHLDLYAKIGYKSTIGISRIGKSIQEKRSSLRRNSLLQESDLDIVRLINNIRTRKDVNMEWLSKEDDETQVQRLALDKIHDITTKLASKLIESQEGKLPFNLQYHLNQPDEYGITAIEYALFARLDDIAVNLVSMGADKEPAQILFGMMPNSHEKHAYLQSLNGLNVNFAETSDGNKKLSIIDRIKRHKIASIFTALTIALVIGVIVGTAPWSLAVLGTIATLSLTALAAYQIKDIYFKRNEKSRQREIIKYKASLCIDIFDFQCKVKDKNLEVGDYSHASHQHIASKYSDIDVDKMILSIKNGEPTDLDWLNNPQDRVIVQQKILEKLKQSIYMRFNHDILQDVESHEEFSLATTLNSIPEQISPLEYAYIGGFSDIANSLVASGIDTNYISILKDQLDKTEHKDYFHSSIVAITVGLDTYANSKIDTNQIISWAYDNRETIALVSIGIVCLALIPFTAGLSGFLYGIAISAVTSGSLVYLSQWSDDKQDNDTNFYLRLSTRYSSGLHMIHASMENKENQLSLMRGLDHYVYDYPFGDVSEVIQKVKSHDSSALECINENKELVRIAVMEKLRQSVISKFNSRIIANGETNVELSDILNEEDIFGITPLEYATFADLPDIQQILIGYGAEVTKSQQLLTTIQDIDQATYNRNYAKLDLQFNSLPKKKNSVSLLATLNQYKISIAIATLGLICLAAAPFTAGFSIILYGAALSFVTSGIGLYQASRLQEDEINRVHKRNDISTNISMGINHLTSVFNEKDLILLHDSYCGMSLTTEDEKITSDEEKLNAIIKLKSLLAKHCNQELINNPSKVELFDLKSAIDKKDSYGKSIKDYAQEAHMTDLTNILENISPINPPKPNIICFVKQHKIAIGVAVLGAIALVAAPFTGPFAVILGAAAVSCFMSVPALYQSSKQFNEIRDLVAVRQANEQTGDKILDISAIVLKNERHLVENKVEKAKNQELACTSTPRKKSMEPRIRKTREDRPMRRDLLMRNKPPITSSQSKSEPIARIRGKNE